MNSEVCFVLSGPVPWSPEWRTELAQAGSSSIQDLLDVFKLRTEQRVHVVQSRANGGRGGGPQARTAGSAFYKRARSDG